MIDLQKLAALAGIQTSYRDVWGNEHHVPEKTLAILLDRLGFNSPDQETSFSIKVLAENKQTALPAKAESWQLSGDNFSQQGEVVQEHIIIPALKMGYYELNIISATGTTKLLLIVAPDKCWLPPAMKPSQMHKRKRVWGIATQLYSIRSETNLGIGDFGDLAELVKSSAAFGIDVIGLNPLHAMFPNNANAFSPYAPSNRLFLNSIYINVKSVDGYQTIPHLEQKIIEARNSELVDYPLVSTIKLEILEKLFIYFQAEVDKEKYNNFVVQGGSRLEQQALFDALSEYFIKQNSCYNWHQWPPEFQNPNSNEVNEFAAGNKPRLEFYKWLQFIADSQLAHVQNLALQHNMQIGLYRDLAVGSESAGAEIWLDPKRFIHGVAVGAPPDEYNPKGQNWGLPPLNPFTLRSQGYQAFIELLKANMRHARALRIDHAFGLSRLFLIPEGFAASDGAYLNYPFKEMLAILRLESHLNQCIVIGEDLGTFPPNYKQNAANSGVLSYKLLYFERDQNGFISPNYYPELSLATLSTHDLPTLSGWLDGTDIDERDKLNLYRNQDLLAKDREARPNDKKLLLTALQKAGFDDVAHMNVQQYLAKSPAAIVMVQLEDILGVKVQANMPATTTERPNWRMKLPIMMEEIISKNGKLAKLAKPLNSERQNSLLSPPSATYRLQFHKDFTFYNAAEIIPYLAELGISHVYASPYLKARPGSTHGYDIIDHNSFNPELGGEKGFEVFLETLNKYGLRHILDFVPNHMGVGVDNEWWQSVLENGRDSAEAKYFDIDWKPRYGVADEKVIIPALGNNYGEVLSAGELKLVYDAQKNKCYVHYFENKFPIRPDDSPLDIEQINSDNEALHQLLERQHYRLAYWRVASTEINYRRFFDINELAGLRAEEPELFDKMHKLVFSLLEQNKLDGLRIDHIDGLADPAGYCRNLREKSGANMYLTVEKILASHENLRDTWQIQGTSGYDALNQIAGLFINKNNEKIFDRIYRRFTDNAEDFTSLVYQSKLKIMATSLASEVLSLSLLLKTIADDNRYSRDYTLDNLRQALQETIGYFPVYRSYVTINEIDSEDKKFIDWAIGKAKKYSNFPDTSIFDFIKAILIAEDYQLDYNKIIFIRKFQQLSGPVMAKGLEDTTFYRFNRLLSLNEVGGDPSKFGMSIKAFHQINQQRAEKWPHSMITTATHDTKRGEDARCRISVLSEMPKHWNKAILHWAKFNRSRKNDLEGKIVPSPNEEYFIYQTLIGSWPNQLLNDLNFKEIADYVTRLKEYLTKALREAKVNSSWAHPNEQYEAAIYSFIEGIIDISKPNLFLDDFLPFCRQIAMLGAVNSLSQLLIKLTMPGVPDIYQGTENWDLSLVDPDNRRPVNYKANSENLALNEPLHSSLNHWQDGLIKQHLLKTLLKHRLNNKEVYSEGSYQSLKTIGKFKNHIIAFRREYMGRNCLIVAPVLFAAIANKDFPIGEAWLDTSIKLPKGNFENIINGNKFNGVVKLSDLLNNFPLALLVSDY